MRVLLVAGSPEPSSPALLSSLAREAGTVVAVDRGADACRAAGVVPDAFCGDADTVNPETLRWLRARVAGGENGGSSTPLPASSVVASDEGTGRSSSARVRLCPDISPSKDRSACGADRSPAPDVLMRVTPADDVHEVPEIHGLYGELGIRLFPPAKYDTDLSLAFSCARQLAAERDEPLEVTVTCASAGRMDHALAVFGVLAANADLAPRLVEDAFECRILSPRGTGTWVMGEDASGLHFSFVALADGTLVSEAGMRWCLDRFRVDALRDRGISNVIESSEASVTCHEGILAAFLTS